MQQTRLSRRWLVKIMIFLVAATGLGVWGLFDATMAYPARGRAHAEYMEYQYLLAMGQASLPVLPVNDPVSIHAELKSKKTEMEISRASAEAAGQQLAVARTSALQIKLQWLESLKLVGDLDPEHTIHTDPQGRFSELSAKWQAKDQPKPLSGLDLPMQWAFVFIGFGLSSYLLALVMLAGTKKYKYDPETRQLTLPGGATMTPGEIEDIDKRKWDKFIVQIKSGGKWRKLDLLRYDPLETWFLEMEKETSFYEPPADDDADVDGDLDDDVDDGGDHDEHGDEFVESSDEETAKETA